MTSMITDGLDLILLIIINQVRWRSGVVLAMFARFNIRSQQGHVEHRVYHPLEGKFESVHDW